MTIETLDALCVLPAATLNARSGKVEIAPDVYLTKTQLGLLYLLTLDPAGGVAVPQTDGKKCYLVDGQDSAVLTEEEGDLTHRMTYRRWTVAALIETGCLTKTERMTEDDAAIVVLTEYGQQVVARAMSVVAE